MRPANRPHRSTNDLLALLEERAATDHPAARLRLWQRALYDPLRLFLGAPGKNVRARMMRSAWRIAGGGDDGPPDELPLLCDIVHAGSLIIDDIEDGSPMRRGQPALHTRVGTPLALNAGNWLYFWPFELLGQMSLPAPIRLALYELLGKTLLRCHEGQALDLSVCIPELSAGEVSEVVAATTELKTGTLMSFAAEAGARVAGGSEPVVAALRRFGSAAGIGLQMFDDLSGVASTRRASKGDEDLRLGRPTWVWAWLVEALDEVTYTSAVSRLREVMAGAAPDALRRWLRHRIAVVGSMRAQQHLTRAIRELVAVVGPSEHIDELSSELASLEARYVSA